MGVTKIESLNSVWWAINIEIMTMSKSPHFTVFFSLRNRQSISWSVNENVKRMLLILMFTLMNPPRMETDQFMRDRSYIWLIEIMTTWYDVDELLSLMNTLVIRKNQQIVACNLYFVWKGELGSECIGTCVYLMKIREQISHNQNTHEKHIEYLWMSCIRYLSSEWLGSNRADLY